MPELSCGIVGLPNVGKSTLFNTLTLAGVEACNYPFTTIDPKVGVVEVPDERLKELSKISHSAKIVPATMQFVDIAGLVAGASQGEGLGNAFLSHIRETDAILHVVRCFDSEDIIHVTGSVDPIRDIEMINLELRLADLESVSRIIPRIEKQAKTNKEAATLFEILLRAQRHLDDNQPVRSLELTAEEHQLLKPYPLLTMKKVLYVANVAESDLPGMENSHVQRVREYAEQENNKVVVICAELEQQIAQLPKEEQQEFLQSAGLEQSALNRLIKASFEMLELISYLTTGEIETRAWTIRRGTKAAEAAGKIHSDIQRGFIRAEVVSYEDMVEFQGRVGAREKGKARAEGKEYTVKDGDVILFLHN